MIPSDLLTLIVEASIALAGFAGIVGAIAQRGTSSPHSIYQLNLVNLLSTSFGALFMSLTALAMLVAGVDDSLTWRFSSGLGLAITAYFTFRSYQTLSSASNNTNFLRRPMMVAIILTCALQAWNVLSLAEFWPLFVLLIVLFAIACAAFTRLVFALDSFTPSQHGDR